MPQLVATEPPPDHYYAENLLAVIKGVQGQYADMLTADEVAFGRRVAAMSTRAQRLLARLISRKGPCVRVGTLAYREIDDVDAALDEAVGQGAVLWCPATPADRLLRLFTREELKRWFPHVDGGGGRKAEHIERIAARYPEQVLRSRVAARCPWVALGVADHLMLYQLLFFGDRYQDLSTFVIRDLGITRYEGYELRIERRLFADRWALDQFLDLSNVGDYVNGLGQRPCPELAEPVLKALWRPYEHRMFERKRCKILNRLGRGLERAGAFDMALACYARSAMAPARERTARILNKLGDVAGVERLTRAMCAHPRSALELDFARHFGRARAPRARNKWLIEVVELLNAPAVNIECVAAAMLTANGGQAWHFENHLPMGLFGLAYWDWVFAPVDGMFVNAFQTAPIDLFWPDFFDARRDCCADPLALSDAALRDKMLDTAVTRRGITNRLVSWHAFDQSTVQRLLTDIPMADVRKLLAIVVEDLDRVRTGFPDLTVTYGRGVYEFVEVKGPNDQLQRHQHLWIAKLTGADLPARVRWFR